MHCKACDALLTEKEATKRDPFSGEFTDLCSDCWSHAYEALLAATEDHNTNQIVINRKKGLDTA